MAKGRKASTPAAVQQPAQTDAGSKKKSKKKKHAGAAAVATTTTPAPVRPMQAEDKFAYISSSEFDEGEDSEELVEEVEVSIADEDEELYEEEADEEDDVLGNEGRQCVVKETGTAGGVIAWGYFGICQASQDLF